MGLGLAVARRQDMVAMLAQPLAWWLLGLIVVLVTLVLVVVSLDSGPKPGSAIIRWLRYWRAWGTTQREQIGKAATDGCSMAPAAASRAVTRLTLAQDQHILGVIECPVDQLCERTVGRSNTLCDQVIDASTVSRCHARLIWEPQKTCWYVEDLGSKNGTCLDGIALRPYTPAPLKHHARLALGGLELTLTTDLPGGSASAAVA